MTKKTIEELKQARKEKMLHNQDYVVSQIVKPLARQDSWSSSHEGCFRASIHETDEHIRAKFERWLIHRKQNDSVFTELIFKTGDRPDLLIVNSIGEVAIEEILQSEEKSSIEDKKGRYPFKIKELQAEWVLKYAHKW